MNWGSEISEHHCFDTDLNRPRDFSGRRRSIASIISGGRLFIADIYDSGGEARYFLGLMEEIPTLPFEWKLYIFYVTEMISGINFFVFSFRQCN